MRGIRTDLPFKVRDAGIVILKDLPVLQCGHCPQYLIEDTVMTRIAKGFTDDETRAIAAWLGKR